MLAFNHNEFLPVEKLTALAETEAENYINASPFAHGVYDNVFSDEILDAVIAEFNEGQKTWKEYESKYEKKLQMNADINLLPVTRALVHNLNSEPFLRFLEKLTGIKGLIPDPYLVGGGLHKIPRGGKLGIHVDFNENSVMKVYRRLNILIYLNKDWKEEYGGHFELWDANKNACMKKILPVFNRMAIFSTTNTSFHGHPEPLTCPEDRERISLALYYYTAGERGNQAISNHSTQFLTEDGGREELSTPRPSLLQRAVNKILR
ncbi:Rps23 Pro-64 3,4-dihydroxylase Tpa1-like proline 4-hydroxylase [Alteromonadaceae bacterium 2753L.S.0a.02]|nr:Rps23 Pro-64 3,4-dihydroxylase Tpa1-like proline 4-hydroxylase [Alteromonadaceae bacterium 2753L.S.0a.02]